MVIAILCFSKLRPGKRGQRNRIKSLKRDDGSIAIKQEELDEVATSFYKDLFTAGGGCYPATRPAKGDGGDEYFFDEALQSGGN